MIAVSDHAVLRYLERAMGINVAKLRDDDYLVVLYLKQEIGLDVEHVRDSIAHVLSSHRTRRLIEFSAGVPCKIVVRGLVFCLVENTVTTFIGRKNEIGRNGSSRAGRCRPLTTRRHGI